MSNIKVIANRSDLVAVADAIRNRTGEIGTMSLSEMKNALDNEEDSEVVVAINTTTTTEYNNLQTALSGMSDGQTVQILKDIAVNTIFVPINTALDLNGHSLTSSYIASYGDIIDSSTEKGILNVPKENFLIQKNNSQLPVKVGNGYQFFEVLKFNEAIQSTQSRYVYQPFIESSAHELLKQGFAASEVKIGALLISKNGMQYTRFYNSDTTNQAFWDSYNSSTTGGYGSYSSMLRLSLNSGLLTGVYHVMIKSETGVEILSTGIEYVAETESETETT